jgi:HK97 family phage major capsid protein
MDGLTQYAGAGPSPFAFYRAPIVGGGSLLPFELGIASFAVQDLNSLRSVEALSDYQRECRARLVEIDAEYQGLPFPDDVREEFGTLQGLAGEDGEIEARIIELRGREEIIRGVVDSGNDRAAEAGTTPVIRTPAASRAATRPSARRIPENVYALEEYRKYASSGEDLTRLYRDGARRAAELATYPDDRIDRAVAVAQVDRLLQTADDEHGTLAQRILRTGSPGYEAAFGKMVKELSTNGLHGDQLRALSLGSDAGGGFAVPFQLDPTVIATSNGVINPIRQMARVERILGKKWEGVTSAGITVSRAAEGDESADNSPVLAQPSVGTSRVQAFVPFSIELQQAWGALSSEVARMLADAKDIEEASSFVSGDGLGNNPQGVVAGLGAPQQVASAGAGAFAVADVYNVKNAVPPRFRAQGQFLGETSIYDLVRRFDTNGGANMWVQLADPTPSRLIGYPAREISTMDSTLVAGKLVLAFGDFSQFLIAERIGMAIELVPHVFGANRRPTGQRGIYAIWANGSGILVPNAFRVLKIG